MPFNPCGMVCDWLRQCYRTKIRPFKDSDTAVTIRWFFCQAGAKALPGYNRFASGNNTTPAMGDARFDPLAWKGPGEVVGSPRPFVQSIAPAWAEGQRFCGALSDFAEGATFDPSFAMNFYSDGAPACCVDRPLLPLSPHYTNHGTLGLAVGGLQFGDYVIAVTNQSFPPLGPTPALLVQRPDMSQYNASLLGQARSALGAWGLCAWGFTTDTDGVTLFSQGVELLAVPLRNAPKNPNVAVSGSTSQNPPYDAGSVSAGGPRGNYTLGVGSFFHSASPAPAYTVETNLVPLVRNDDSFGGFSNGFASAGAQFGTLQPAIFFRLVNLPAPPPFYDGAAILVSLRVL